MPRNPRDTSTFGDSDPGSVGSDGVVDSRDTFAPDGAAQGAGGVPTGDRTGTVTPEASGRYEELSDGFIGEGGVGWVRAIRDTHLDRVVARKEVGVRWPGPRATASGPDKVDRFLREARVTAQLEHPSIVPVYELGIGPDGSLYYTMRRVRGRTLHAAITACPGLVDRLDLLGAFVQVCQAVAYAHSRGVVHRDLKPQNVMLGAFGETVVLDWGLARLAGHADPAVPATGETIDDSDAARTLAGTIHGTPAYMSPEQAAGGVADPRSDIWALGAILYHLLTGSPPYEAPSALAVLGLAAAAHFPTVRERCPEAPAELAAIAELAMRPRPEHRYASAAILAEEVERWRTGVAVQAYRYTRRERVLRWLRAHRVEVGSAGVAMVVIVAVTAAAFLRVVAERDRATAAGVEARIAALQARSREEELRGDLGAALALTRAAVEVAGGPGLASDAPELLRLENAGGGALVLPVPDPKSWDLAPDGTHAVLLGADGAARIWDLGTGTSTCELRGGAIADVGFADGGATVVAAVRDGAIAWSVATCAQAWSQPSTQPARSRYVRSGRVLELGDSARILTQAGVTELADLRSPWAMRADGSRILGLSRAEPDRLLELDTRTGERLTSWRLPSAAIARLDYQAEGDRIVVATEDGVSFVDDPQATGGWRQVGELRDRPTALVARGDFVATQARDGLVRAWRLTSGERWLNSVGRPFAERSRGLAMAPAGARLAATRDTGDLLVWSYVGQFGYRRPSTGLVGGIDYFVATDGLDRGLVFPRAGLPRAWRNPADPPGRWSLNPGWSAPGMGLVFSADQRTLLAVSARGDLSVRDAATGAALADWKRAQAVGNVQLARTEGGVLVTLSNRSASTGTNRTDRVPAEAGGKVDLVAVQGDGTESEVWTYDADDLCDVALATSGTALVTLQRRGRLVRFGVGDDSERIADLETPVSANANLLIDAAATLAVIADGSLVQRRDLASGLALPALHTQAEVVVVDVRADGQQFATVDAEQHLQVWSRDGLEPAWTADVGGAVAQVDLLASGAVLLRTTSGELELRDSGGLRWRKRGVTGAFLVSPDESMVATGASTRSSVGIRRMVDGATTQALWDERTWVWATAWSADSRQLAVVNSEGYLQSFPVAVVDPPADFLRTGALTNLRACADSLAVVPVVPYPPATTVWAPAESCRQAAAPSTAD